MNQPSRGWRLLTGYCIVNLSIYVTRYLTAATLPEISAEYSTVSKAGLGYLATAFVGAYLLSSFVCGPLGDRYHRPRLMGLGATLAASATAAVWWTRGLLSLGVCRAVQGVGQAAFVAIAPAALSDVFAERRASALGIFNIGMPVGTALSYVLAGVLLGQGARWQTVFVAVGIPSIALGLLLFTTRDPARSAAAAPAAPFGLATLGSYLGLLRTRSLAVNILAGSANAFAMGGLAYWMPTYLHLERGLSVAAADIAFGGLTAAAGAIGVVGGGYLGDRLSRSSARAQGVVAGWSALAAVPMFYFFFAIDRSPLMWAVMAVAEVLLFIPTGPALTLTMDVTAPGARARANALAIVLIHLLGEALSPAIIGALADHADMKAGLSAAAVAVGLSGLLWLLSTRYLAADMLAAKQAESGATRAP